MMCVNPICSEIRGLRMCGKPICAEIRGHRFSQSYLVNHSNAPSATYVTRNHPIRHLHLKLYVFNRSTVPYCNGPN